MNLTNAQKIHQGLTIILRREPKTEASIYRDVLFAGDVDGPYTAADRLLLNELGWGQDEGSWCFSM
jgi:hypothetical protein